MIQFLINAVIAALNNAIKQKPKVICCFDGLLMFILSWANSCVVIGVPAPSDLSGVGGGGGGDLLAWKRYTMPENVIVVQTHSSRSKDKNVHNTHVQ